MPTRLVFTVVDAMVDYKTTSCRQYHSSGVPQSVRALNSNRQYPHWADRTVVSSKNL